MDTENFESYFYLISESNFIGEEYKKLLISSISRIERIAKDFDDSYDFERKKQFIKEFSTELREIMEVIIEIFVNKIENIDHIEEVEELYNLNKIDFLNKNGYIQNKDTYNALHQIRKIGNYGNHLIVNDLDVDKFSIVGSLKYISIILHNIFLQKSSMKFKSDRYYVGGKTLEKIDETIKKNINDRDNVTIKINDERVINILFDKKISFHIPLYQRGYSWGKNEISDLFNDVEKRIKDQNDHFFGNVTFIKFKKDGKNKIKIVDGQQRFTTMILILKAIHERYKKIYNNDSNNGDNNLNEFILKKEIPLTRIDDKRSTKMLNDIWKNNKIIVDLEMQNNNIFKAYNLIYKKFENMSLELIDNYYTVLKRFVVGINWTTGYNEFELFESLNSKGKVLSDFDIFKNYLFSIVDKNIEEKYEETLASIFDNLIQNKLDLFEDKKRDKITNEFLKKIIVLNGSKVVSGNKIFSQFKKVFEEKRVQNNLKIFDLTIEDYKELLVEFSKILTAVLLTQSANKEIWIKLGLAEYFDYYFTLLNSASYSSVLIPYIIDDRNFSYDDFDGEIRKVNNPEEFKKILKLLEFWKIKRDVSHNEGNETIGSYIDVFNTKIREELKYNNNFFELLSKKIKEEEGFLRMPSQEKFHDTLSKGYLANTSVVKYIFYRIEQKLNNSSNDFSKKLKSYPIISKESKDRNEKFNTIVKNMGSINVEVFDMIGNYFAYGYGENINLQKKIKDSNGGVLDLLNLLKTDNISIDIENKHNFIDSINNIKKLNNDELDYEEFIKKRSKQIADLCNDIFNEKLI